LGGKTREGSQQDLIEFLQSRIVINYAVPEIKLPQLDLAVFNNTVRFCGEGEKCHALFRSLQGLERDADLAVTWPVFGVILRIHYTLLLVVPCGIFLKNIVSDLSWQADR
jgi:hypothetical protein